MPGPGQRGGIKYPRGKRKTKRRVPMKWPPRAPRDGDPRPPQGGPGPRPPGGASGGRIGHSSGGVTSWQDLVKKKYSS